VFCTADNDYMTRYFLLKVREYPVLRRSYESNEWSLPIHKKDPQPVDVVNEAFDQGPVIFIACVNGTRAYQGFARVLEKV